MLPEMGQFFVSILIFFKSYYGPPSLLSTGLTESAICPPNLPDSNPLYCDPDGYCQCCLQNGSSITGGLSPAIKACNCLMDKMESENQNKMKQFGKFVARCESDGTYSLLQRHSSSGQMWCAHPYTGQKLTKPDRHIKACDCPFHNYDSQTRKILGMFVPKCDSDGNYALIQSHPSTGLSWCVDPGTGTNVTAKTGSPILTCECPIQRINAKNQTGFGHFVPKCAPDGTFEKKQLHSSSGKSWCCHPTTGEKITEPSRQSKIKFCDCLVEKFQTVNRTALGLMTPSCEEDGSYAPIQLHPSTGLSWCADPQTGRNASEPRLEAPLHCQCYVEAFKAQQKPPLGRFVSQCDSDGSYHRYQLHPSSGFSWCADPLTGQNTTIPSRDTRENNCQ